MAVDQGDRAVLPPKELLDEVRKAELNAEFGRSLGLPVRCTATITPRYVSRFIQLIANISQAEVNRALKEIETLRYTDAKQFIGA